MQNLRQSSSQNVRSKVGDGNHTAMTLKIIHIDFHHSQSQEARYQIQHERKRKSDDVPEEKSSVESKDGTKKQKAEQKQINDDELPKELQDLIAEGIDLTSW